jgi:hypothetical protein
MKQDRYEEGRFSRQGHGLGTVDRQMLEQRAREIAQINGRTQVLESDVEAARHELLGPDPLEPPASPDEQIIEEDLWNPVAESHGSKAQTTPAPDEQTFAEKLVKDGVDDAEHDQMLRAARARLEGDGPA